MQRKAYVLYRFFDFDQNQPRIGGIQTYLTDLMEILNELGFKTIIFQPGDKEVYVQKSCYEVCQIKANSFYNVIRYIERIADIDNDLLIFGSDTLIVRNHFKHSIAIQHGISWDIPTFSKHSILRIVGATSFQTYMTVKRLERVSCLVCVDFNFQNWYRSQMDHERIPLTVIPNYTRIDSCNEKNNDIVRIIFARRLFPYRGTRVFTKAIKRILIEYKHVKVTIAGNGPDEQWMKDELNEFNNVEFTQYESSDSLLIHSDKHIAVVPTVGSEGTSLSLLEAMSAQCAVVASDVGGLSNIIIAGYNGLMVKAGDYEQLYRSIKMLIDDASERNRIARAGYDTVKYGFSYEMWKSRWIEVISSVTKA